MIEALIAVLFLCGIVFVFAMIVIEDLAKDWEGYCAHLQRIGEPVPPDPWYVEVYEFVNRKGNT